METGKFKIRDITYTALFTALMAASAFIKVPFFPVSFTLQTFFVLFSALFLQTKFALTSQILYILLGLCGIPIFSNGGGIGYVFSPSFGYMIGFLPCVIIVGSLIKYIKSKTFKTYFAISALGILALYICGVIYMFFILNFYMDKNQNLTYFLMNGFIIFLPAEILKILTAIYTYRKIEKLKFRENVGI